MEVKNREELFIFNLMLKGDKEAFRFFFEKYYADLCNLVNFYLHDPATSEEIVQDIYVYLWEKKGKIKIDSSVKSYLYKSSKNKTLNYLRNEKAKLNIHKKLTKITENNFDMVNESNMDAAQLRELINQSVNSLPPKCKEIFVLSKEKELSYKEIADQLGISVKTVENQMGKALKILREILRPYYNKIFILFISLLFNLL